MPIRFRSVAQALGVALLTSALAGAACGPPDRSTTPRARPTLRDQALRLCRSDGKGLDGLFTARFRAKVPMRSLARTFARFHHELGPCRGVKHLRGAHLVLRYTKGELPVRLYLDEQGAIGGFWYSYARRYHDTWHAVQAAFRKLPGAASLTVREGATPLAAVAPNKPLAVGSAFKLYVLEALVREIRAGRLRWDDVIRLDPERRSLPPSLFRRWPNGAPLNLSTLATLMISQSDNTATDHLLLHLGRPLVERIAGKRNRPFLTTLDMFKLKSPNHAALARQYVAADEAGRRKLLTKLAALPRRSVRLWTRPRLVDRVEWFFTTSELCDVMLRVKQQKLLDVNPGLARWRGWKRTAYKGGSEPGVLNLTHAVQHGPTGRWFCVSATWNDPQHRLKRKRLERLVARALDLLRIKVQPPPPRPVGRA